MVIFLIFGGVYSMKKVALLTSGGDSPGMNACIRAVVRTGNYHGIEIIGVRQGYNGLINGWFSKLGNQDVSNIIQRGGTILQTARCDEFKTSDGRKRAFNNLKNQAIEALIVIGGDGSYTGAKIFEQEFGVKCIGIPGTIDNDLYGTDNTIGYDTALNTVVEAVDKLRDTASSHHRLFIVEVMGRDAGFIALRSGIGVGAEAILVPETPTYIDHLINKLETDFRQDKSSAIVIVAEGDELGGANQVAQAVKERFDKFDIRVSILGHIQRGGSPSAYDRVLASQLGFEAVNALMNGRSGVAVGLVDKKIVYTSFENAIKHHQELNQNLLKMAEILSL